MKPADPPAVGSNPRPAIAGSPRRFRFLWLLAAAGLFVLIVGGFAVFDLQRSQQIARDNYTDSVRGLELTGELHYETQEARRTLLYALVTTDSNRQVTYADQSRAADEQVKLLQTEWRKLAQLPEEIAAVRQLAGDWQAYLKIRDELIASMLEGNPAQAIERDLREGLPAFDRVREDLQLIQGLCKKQASQLLEHADASFQNSLQRLIVILALTFLVAGVGAVTIQRTTRLRAIQASEARLRRDLEALSEELILLDPAGRVLLWNAAAETAWGRARAEVLGRPLLEALPEIAATALPAAIAAALKDGVGSLHSELRVIAPDGERFYEARVLSFAAGTSLFLHDISARKRAEASQARLTAILEATPDFVGIADAQGNALYLNRAGRRMTGHADDADITLLKIPDFSPAWANEIILGQALPAALRDGLWAGETAFKGADGNDIPASQVILAHRDASGAVQSFSTVARDITAQKRARAEFENLNRRLIETSRQAGMAEVATGVLHNVGNVLNSVNVSANLVVSALKKSKTASLARAVQLLREHRDDLGPFLTHDPKGKQLPPFLAAISEQLTREQSALTTEVDGLQANIEHIKQIVAMQQNYAKVSGAMESLPIDELVEDALRMTSSGLVRHEIKIAREFAPVPPVLVDRHKVLQIVVNLISNAKQALDHRATERTLVLRIALGATTDRVCIEIIDNGVGIPAENLARIFNHGFTTKKSGHGFGLHSCANAAKELGGRLSVQSAGAGLGATFRLELPATISGAAQSGPGCEVPAQNRDRAA